MSIDIFLRFVMAAAGVAGMSKVIYDVLMGRRGRLREEYKFARDFLKEVEDDPDMHPFLKEKGYQAITGESKLKAGEVEYILSLKDAARALKDYSLGYPYLDHLPDHGDLQIAFKPMYRNQWSRAWRKWGYLLLYVVFGMLSFSPWLMGREVFKNSLSSMLLAFVFTLFVFGYHAFASLRAGVRISRAERLVRHQRRHTQRIVTG